MAWICMGEKTLAALEGEPDYSALVMAFIRSIEARAGSTIDRGRGGPLHTGRFDVSCLDIGSWTREAQDDALPQRVDSNGILKGILRQ